MDERIDKYGLYNDISYDIENIDIDKKSGLQLNLSNV
jgi:hypothetical protein